MFLAPWFAVAGLIAAAGPLVIHLLNRRRYQVVPWAAMDFLREAVFRNRRIMHLRDLLLLALRTFCILAFGAAMARPFLGTAMVGVDPDQPVHAVLLIDNSLSMAYRKGQGTLLDEAKTEAQRLIEGLPRGSRISVLPICGSAAGVSYTAYYTKEDAVERLQMIESVDRAALPREAIDLAVEACGRVQDMPRKEIVLLTDRQVSGWPADSLADQLQKLPSPIQVVQLQPEEVANAWIADFRLRDGVADRQTAAVFVATVRYEGTYSQHDVLVTLAVDGLTFDVRSLELQPGQAREVEFAPYRFENLQEDDRLALAAAEVSVAIRREGVVEPDGLPADDRRFLVVPVVEQLPVVFVDQWGEDEQPRVNRYGETFHLRRLLAPMASGSQRQRQLVAERHVRIDQVDRSLLEDARLVVIAGVASPEPAVPLLREYVEQGGKLVIAAGGQFDPALWTAAAWQDGLGILPAPLSPVTVGRLPEESNGPAEPFQLDYNSLKHHDYFLLSGSSEEEMQDLYRLPYFFKTVAAEVGDETREALVATMTKHLRQRRADLAEMDRRLAEWDQRETQQELSAAERDQRDNLQRQRARLRPSWLLWAAAEASGGETQLPEEEAVATKFSVLARYTNQLPYLIERRIGRGKVLFVSSGVHTGWNTLSVTNTILVFDRVLRGLLEETLPDRTLSTQRTRELPIAAAQRNARVTLSGPGETDRPLSIDALGADRYGVSIDRLPCRGHYRVTATRGSDSRAEGAEDKLWETLLAVNGPAEESEGILLPEGGPRPGSGAVDSLETAQAFAAGGLQRAQLQGTNLWKWVMLGVLACLLLELAVLAWPSTRREPTA
ncbi:MAG: BatA domain-containing protein [Pirellulales bacterium]|nr:BatA domain-containing protein [Pirellulales bacterium]